MQVSMTCNEADTTPRIDQIFRHSFDVLVYASQRRIKIPPDLD